MVKIINKKISKMVMKTEKINRIIKILVKTNNKKVLNIIKRNLKLRIKYIFIGFH